MTISRRFINFALFCCVGLLMLAFQACKGRTMENMEPTGDTVEVVIMQQTPEE